MPGDETLETRPVPRRLPRWAVALAFAALVGFLALVGAGLKRVQAGPITVGSPAPSFSLFTFDGQQIDTAELQGKVLVVNFWASWCIPCEEEAAALEQAWEDYRPGGQVVFLGLNYVDVEQQALAYLERFGITYPNGPDLRTAVSQMFRVSGVPETYIIDQSGRLRYIKKGPFDSIGEIKSAVDPLLP